MRHNRLTVADLRALKGQRKFTMLYVETLEEARAAAAAGIDMLSIVETYWTPEMRAAAGDCFVQVGLLYGHHCTSDDYLRAAHKGLRNGGDSFYCAGSFDTIAKLTAEGIPVIGHAGLVPSRATWTGGFKAVGKTAESALRLFDDLRRFEDAGAIGVELEVVPDRVAAEVARRSPLILLGMGAGPHADAQYLFAEDVLGCTRGHKPRHARSYADFAAEYDRLQQMRIDAFAAFRAEVDSGAYPAPQHVVPIADEEFDSLLAALD